MNPWEMNWQAEPAATPATTPPWEMNWSPTPSDPTEAMFAPVPQIDRDKLALAFRGDPLAGLDPARRETVSNYCNLFPNPDEEAKKQVLSLYLSDKFHVTPAAAQENLQTFLDTFTNQKNISIEAAYQRIGEILNPKPAAPVPDLKPLNQSWRGIGAPLDQAARDEAKKQDVEPSSGGVVDAYENGAYHAYAAKQGAAAMVNDLQQRAAAWLYDRLPDAAQRKVAPLMAVYLMKTGDDANRARENAAIAQGDAETHPVGNGQGIYETYKKAGIAAAAEQTVYALVAQAQPLGEMALFGKNPYAAALYMGGQTTGEKYLDVSNDPNMTAAQKVANLATVGAVGTASGLPVTHMLGKMFAGAATRDVRQGVGRALVSLTGETAVGTAAMAGNQFADNLTDYLTDRGGVLHKDLTSQERYDYLTNGVIDAGITGGATMGALGGVNLARTVGPGRHYSYADVEHGLAVTKATVDATVDQLTAADHPTDAQIEQLRMLQQFQRSGDMKQAAEYLVGQQGKPEPADGVADLDLDDQAAIGRRDFDALPQPDDRTDFAATKAAVDELAGAYPDLTFKTVRTTADIPADVRERADLAPDSAVRGMIDEPARTVYVVAAKLAPDQVAPVILHEAAGHYGLRTAFGPRVDAILDGVARDYLDQYRPKNIDDDGNPVPERLPDTRYGQAVKDVTRAYAPDRTDAAARRLQAEEMLAEIAQTDVKPSWWKEILARFKQLLRSVPGFRNLRFTDREIEGMLSASKRAAQTPHETPVAGGDDVMAAAALRRQGAPNTAEQPGQLRDGNVPYNRDVFSALGYQPARIYADYEFLFGRHSEYFSNPDEIKDNVERVLSNPEFAIDEGKHIGLIRPDADGDIIEVKLNKELTGGDRHVRSVFKLNTRQYEERKNRQLPRSSQWGELMPDSPAENGNNKQKAWVTDAIRDNNASGKNVKTSLAIPSDAEIAAVAKMLLPGVASGRVANVAEAARYLRDTQGVELSGRVDRELTQWALGEAKRLNSQQEKRAEVRRYRQWLSELHPEISGIMEQLGESVKIKPDAKFGNRKDFGGSWIDWKKGMPSDEAAKFLHVDEEKLVDALRDRTKKGLQDEFRKYEKDLSGDFYFDKLDADERARTVEELTDSVLDGKTELTRELRKQYPEVAEAVYQRITGKDGKPDGAFDWDAAANALRHADGDVDGYMQGYRAGKSEGGKAYAAVLETVRAERSDLVKAQKTLTDYAYRMLPKGQRDAVLKMINRLAEASPNPSAKYPYGKRRALLENIMNAIKQQRDLIRAQELRDQLAERLQATTLKRGPQSGKPVGKYAPEVQATLDELREISRMSPDRAWGEMEELQSRADQMETAGEDPTPVLERLALLQKFGMPQYKTAPELEQALAEVQTLIHTGRMALQRELEARKQQLEADRRTMIDDVTGGARLLSPQREAQLRQHRAGTLTEAAKGFWRGNQNFEWLMDHLTRFSAQPLENTLGGEMVRGVHRAGQRELTGRRTRGEAFNAEFDRIFGTTGSISRSKIYQNLRKLEEKTGVMRYQRPPESGKGLEYERLTVDEARELLRDHDEGTAPLPEYEAEAIRHQLQDFDAGERGKAAGFRFGDEFTDDVVRRLHEENAAGHVVIPRIKDPGELTEQPLTQAQALQLRLCWDQDNVRYKMMFNGWTHDSIGQLDKFIQPEVRRLGAWMRAELEKDFANVNGVFEKMYYATMPHTENYWPTSYDVNTGAAGNTKDQFGMSYGMAAVSPGALKSRRFHLMEPKADDAFSVYAAHVVQMEHFKALAPVVRDLRGVFNAPDVRRAIQQRHGDAAYSDLIKNLTWIADGGRRDAEKIGLLAAIYSPWVASKMMFNISSAAKQLAGAANYMNDIPVSAFVRGSAEFWKHPRKNARMLMATDYFKNRWAGAMDRDLNMLLDWSSSVAGKQSGWMRALVQEGAILNKAGDALSVVCAGYSVYKYHYDNLLKRGVPEAEAHARAIEEWERSSNRTQQSGQVSDMNSFQLGGTFTRMMTTYLSNPILNMNAEVETTLDALHGRGGVKTIEKAGRLLVLNHVIVPGLMVAISQFFKHREKFDEYEWQEFALASVMGPFEGVFLFGKAFDSLFLAAISGVERGTEALPIAEDVVRAAQQVRKTVKDGFNPEPVEIIKAVENVGAALTPVSNPAAVAGAAGRESRRWWQFLTGDSGKKKSTHTLNLGD